MYVLSIVPPKIYYMKYHRLAIVLLCIGLTNCNQEKEAKKGTIETVLPEMITEVTISPLSSTHFNHELISNGKLSAARSVDLQFETIEPVVSVLVKNGERVKKRTKTGRVGHLPPD